MVVGDSLSPERRDRDEAIAAEPPLDLPPDALAQPMETHQARLDQPQAIAGIVEHGLIRPLDPDVKLLGRLPGDRRRTPEVLIELAGRVLD